ncbi:MAG: transglycosylase domain-containing protein [Bifidobacteriaceae bacterium]|jgi:membrane peptidoglycan carboxypeptidase|nr:transglycosylase domain-containing protein [Bifidobacteriaceae bacterium]
MALRPFRRFGLKLGTGVSKWVAGIAGLAVIAVGGGVVASGLATPGIALVKDATSLAVNVFQSLPSDLGDTDLSQASYIYASDGTTLLATYYDENRVVVPLADISKNMQNAIVALEDRRFWEHGGVDIPSLARAAINNASGGSTQGASTLTQQYVKNVLIERATEEDDPEAVREASEETYGRKLREAKLAIATEAKLGKAKVLEGYLNVAQFGARVYGVEAAAQYYFGVDAKDLSVVQAATIAAITQSPNALDPSQHPAANQARRDTALDDMYTQGYITKDQRDQAKAQSVQSTLGHGKQLQAGCAAANDLAGAAYFCDYVTSVIRNSSEFGATAADRIDLLRRGGLKIVTTLNLTTQSEAQKAVLATVPEKDKSHVSMALSSVEPGTGKILAMTQNTEYPNGNADEWYQTTINFNVDKAYGGSLGFQAGSTFKPFVLADWLDEGHSLTEQFASSREDYSNTTWKATGCLPDNRYYVGAWHVSNSTGNRAVSDAYIATQNSINTAYVAMEYKLDLCSIMDQLNKLDIHRADGADWNLSPSMVLGTNEIAPLTMAAGYAAFAAGGIYCDPIAITKITEADGTNLPVPAANCRRAMSPAVAAGVASAQQKVMSAGTGTGDVIGDGSRPQAGKTGTTDDNVAVWFGGYTRQAATAVWAGYANESKPLQNMWIGGTYFSTAFGGTLPGKAWDKYMTAYSKGKPKLAFPTPPSSIVSGGKADTDTTAVPNLIGMTQAAAQSAADAAGFDLSVSSSEYSDDIAAGRIVSQSPAGGSSVYSGGSFLSVVVSKGPDPSKEEKKVSTKVPVVGAG